MKTENIKAVFTNLLFVIGVILLIVGFVKGTDTAVKSIVFESYPLNSWEESRCDENNLPYMYQETTVLDSSANNSIDNPADISDNPQKAEVLRKHKEVCAAGLTQQRKRQQVEDIVGSISMLISGAALVLTFKGFIFETKK